LGQRVSIQYSVELEDLEAEVQRLSLCALQEMEDARMISQNISDSRCLTLETLGIIEQVRVSLARIDTRLLDVSNIINGYLNFKTKIPAAPPESPQPPEHGHLEELKDRIAEFKNNFDEDAD